MDGNYENITKIINYESSIQFVEKKFRSPDRFYCELNALNLCDGVIKCPKVLDIDKKNLRINLSFIYGESIIAQQTNKTHLINLAEILQKLHCIKVENFGYLNSDVTSQLDNWLIYLTNRFNKRVLDLGLNIENINKFESYFKSNLDNLICEDLKPVLMHHDLKPANIIVTPNNDIALIDFDRACGGDPVSDLAKLYSRTFHREETNEWFFFLERYLGKTTDKDIMKRIEFYDVLHSMGSIAYYNSNPSLKYKKIADNAKTHIRRIVNLEF
ncbi:aminoglycoside phosphotransferase family protein [Bacillus atrophaeus]|uniref:Aminoglycoside phosphotransferase family protein n=1 Tax=Bacillus thuringiensis TaxID=1428 RepID=A0AAW9J9D7_BACTU|nr:MULTISPECIES: aminoglycoside phosphotransferase family protein [Bacillus cereus group]MDZ5475620.1 aminoglycoside phosphotransferase family protein [Bacillus thuringiensis]